MRHIFFATAAATFSFAFSLAGAALADDVTATPCPWDIATCQKADIRYDQTDAALPFEFDVDTGWVPAGSPLQVHIATGIWAHTRVGLAGSFVTTWPDALTLEAYGKPVDGGIFSFRYGAEFIAQGRIDISVLGQHITWTGDLPYVPQFDLEVIAAKNFDAWGWSPGVELSSTTDPQKIATVSIGDLLGGSIPGLDGGFELDVAMELKALYKTDRIVVVGDDGMSVEGGDMTSTMAATKAKYAGEPSVDLAVHPEGTVNYTGVAHLIPSFYITFLGANFSIPVADIPISFGIGDTDWIFDPVNVHVPLPDLRVDEETIDFGVVDVGHARTLAYHAFNDGEAEVYAGVGIDVGPFSTDVDPLEIDPASGDAHDVTFAPEAEGDFTATIVIASNDVDAPKRKVRLIGRGKAKGAPETSAASSGGDNEVEDEVQLGGGCGCVTAGGGSNGGALLGVGLAMAALAARRKRAR